MLTPPPPPPMGWHETGLQRSHVRKNIKWLQFLLITLVNLHADIQASTLFLFQICTWIWLVVGHTGWGAHRRTLLCPHPTLVRSPLDYDCAVYGAASKRIQQKLDPIHHQGLRIALGALRTSPVSTIYVKAQEMYLKNKRKKVSKNYVLKLKTCPNNLAYGCILNHQTQKSV